MIPISREWRMQIRIVVGAGYRCIWRLLLHRRDTYAPISNTIWLF
jgi:hypothetical protein